MKLLKIYLAIIIVAFGIITCTSSTEPVSDNNSPSDHTVSKNGVMHKSGLTNATTNCVECHGTDLRGGNVGVSCYSCHGKKW